MIFYKSNVILVNLKPFKFQDPRPGSLGSMHWDDLVYECISLVYYIGKNVW